MAPTAALSEMSYQCSHEDILKRTFIEQVLNSDLLD
ncbi:hypothetical protein SME46J_08810 [Serratia marcescens]|nr:hypothetical protein SME46J_08810 [Serratia marcescens]